MSKLEKSRRQKQRNTARINLNESVPFIHCSKEQLTFPYVLFRDWDPVEWKLEGKKEDWKTFASTGEERKREKEWMSREGNCPSGQGSAVYCSSEGQVTRYWMREVIWEKNKESGRRIERTFGDRFKSIRNRSLTKLDSKWTDRSSRQTIDPLSLFLPDV